MSFSNLITQIQTLSDEPFYPVGTKIYRVLDSGDIIMEKITAHRIVLEGDFVKLDHLNDRGYGVILPEESNQNFGHGSRVVKWTFDRREANKAAKPYLEQAQQKRIDYNKRRIQELQAEIDQYENGEA